MKIFTFSLSALLIFLLSIFTVRAQTSQTKIRPKINRLVDKLRNENKVHFGYPVGFAGRPETNNRYFKLYLKLKSRATNEELALLTSDHFKPIVIYSFSILYSRGYNKLKDIFVAHLVDTTFYWTAAGCTGSLSRVNWFMLRQLNPTNQDSDKCFLTKEEFDLYCIKLKEQDQFFTCY